MVFIIEAGGLICSAIGYSVVLIANLAFVRVILFPAFVHIIDNSFVGGKRGERDAIVLDLPAHHCTHLCVPLNGHALGARLHPQRLHL